MTTITLAILEVLDAAGSFNGVNDLAKTLNCGNRAWVRTCIQRLRDQGALVILPSSPPRGRGHKTVIRKRNPNSTGLPRKVRKNR